MIEVQNRGGVERSEGRRGFVLKAPAGTGGGEKEKEKLGPGGRAPNKRILPKVFLA